MSRPYFETKVVKIKKEKHKCPTCGQTLPEPNMNGKWVECEDGISRFIEDKKGNWVNGENLDKIKFPCFCSYKYFGKTRYAILSSGVEFGSPDKYNWLLTNIDKQEKVSELFLEYDLDKMILQHDIHILKGRIIIYEEED